MHELAEGQMFARYRILRALGSGLVGESYAAEDTLLDHTVTLKVTHPWPSLPNSARYQFFQEMQGISLIVHPQLAAILDCGDAQGRLYITRTHTEAGSLLSDIGRTHFPSPLAPATAIGYTVQLAEALQHLHNKGYIHGALTFSNILINTIPNTSASQEASPFLIADAGFTYFAQHMGQLQAILLPATAAPEQWQHHYSPACDQYALGVILYFWLAGRLPFLGRPQEVLRQKQYGLPPSLIAINPHVSREQEAVLLRALHPTPQGRYPSVLAFTEALQDTLTVREQKGHSRNSVEISETTVLSLDMLKEMFALERTLSEIEPNEVEVEEIVPTPPPPPLPQISRFESLLASIMEPTPEVLPPPPAPEPIPPTETQPAPEIDAWSQLTSLAASGKHRAISLEPEEKPSPVEPQPRIEPDIAQPIPPASPEPMLPPVEPPTKPQPQEPFAPPAPEPIQPQPQEPEPAYPQEQPIPIRPETPQPTRPDPEPTRPQPQEPDFPAKPHTEPLEPSTPETLPRPEPDIVQPIPTAPFTPPPDIRPSEEPQHSIEAGRQTYEEHALAYLVITSPYQETPQEVLLEAASTFHIGRAGSSDILLEQDNLTSRHHALLKHSDNQFFLFDQRSAKGVFVNGRKLISGVGCVLHNGDNINIGQYTLTFHYKPTKGTASPSYAVSESA